MSLARHFLRRHALALPDALALVAPQQTVWNAPLELSYRQLNQCVDVVKDRLTQQFGVGPGDLVFTDLPNVAEGMVLQLALQELGASVATAKNAEGAQKLIDAVGSSAKAAVVGQPDGSWLEDFVGDQHKMLAATQQFWPEQVPSTTTDGTPASPSSPSSSSSSIAPDTVLGYFNSPKPLCDGEAVELGARAADYLDIGGGDRVAIAITLYHQFSHMAMNAAFSQGACVVLPAVGGLHGCGVPSQRAGVTLDVLAEQRCSLLVADTHTLKALNGDNMAAALAAADLSALRGGVCKVASGADFLDETVELKGVHLATLGKRAA